MNTFVNAFLNALMLPKPEVPPLAVAAFYVAMVGVILTASLPGRADQTANKFPFLASADGSHIGFFETHGKVYKENGVAADPFHLLKADGIHSGTAA